VRVIVNKLKRVGGRVGAICEHKLRCSTGDCALFAFHPSSPARRHACRCSWSRLLRGRGRQAPPKPVVSAIIKSNATKLLVRLLMMKRSIEKQMSGHGARSLLINFRFHIIKVLCTTTYVDGSNPPNLTPICHTQCTGSP
jgi:hypothetical protein